MRFLLHSDKISHQQRNDAGGRKLGRQRRIREHFIRCRQVAVAAVGKQKHCQSRKQGYYRADGISPPGGGNMRRYPEQTGCDRQEDQYSQKHRISSINTEPAI